MREIWKANRLSEIATRRGLLWLYREHVRSARNEQEILTGAPSFMGRTDWDRARLKAVNPSARYYHTGELLRASFAQQRRTPWLCDRHTILFTKLGRAPYRGTELLLKALPLICRQFPDAKLRLADHLGERRGYDRFLRRLIAETGLSKNIELLGYLDANQMAAQLCRTNVFVVASYVENSPNSLCEAMQMGVPCVATYAGGIPSLVEHRQTGLLVPPGDAPALADAIMSVFRDEDLASRLGHAASVVASKRHTPERVLSQVVAAYHDVAADHCRAAIPSAALPIA